MNNQLLTSYGQTHVSAHMKNPILDRHLGLPLQENKMAYDPNMHHRRSLRLKNYNYSQSGLYFITICTQNHLCLFGDIENEKMKVNDAGKMINNWWNKLEDKYRNF